MDRRLMLAVAGSGKTTYLIKKLNLEQRFLIVTYTDNNVANIRISIIRKFGYLPSNITLLSFFQFLIRLCYNPFFKDRIRARGITWEQPDESVRYIGKNNIGHYLTKGRYLYHNRIAKLCLLNCSDLIRERIERYYDYFMLDEVQDLGGNDFNFIEAIIPQKIDCLFVGDFFQHTFDTSKDGSVNKSLYNDYAKYKKRWEKAGMIVDTTTLLKSHRCSPTVCKFVNDNIGINIESNREDSVGIIYVSDREKAVGLINDDKIIKLFFQDSHKFNCKAINWGASKGLDDFGDVCIILNETSLKAFDNKKLNVLAPATRNKLYVACTRAKGNIYFVPHNLISDYLASKSAFIP